MSAVEPITLIVRDVDKHEARLRGADGAVLKALADHCNFDDLCCIGGYRIQRSSGYGETEVGEALKRLKARGLIEERKPSPELRKRLQLATATKAWWVNRERLLALAMIQSRQIPGERGIDSVQSRQIPGERGIDSAPPTVNSPVSEVSADPIPRSGPPSSGSIPRSGNTTLLVEGLAEREGLTDQNRRPIKEEEREPASFNSPPSEELDLATAWEICDAVAGPNRRATRDDGTSSALLALIDDSKRFLVESGYPSDLWPKALRARLQAHYGRTDRSGWLAANGWPLRVVMSQVPHPPIQVREPSYEYEMRQGNKYRLMPRIMIGDVVLQSEPSQLVETGEWLQRLQRGAT